MFRVEVSNNSTFKDIKIMKPAQVVHVNTHSGVLRSTGDRSLSALLYMLRNKYDCKFRIGLKLYERFDKINIFKYILLYSFTYVTYIQQFV